MERNKYADIVLPPDLEWYDELGGQAEGWVCEVDGGGWWHVEELNLSDSFALANDPPKQSPKQFAANDKTRQRVLVEGMDCLPGQLDLF